VPGDPRRLLRKSIGSLAVAERTDFCGLGGSGIVARDTQYEFFRRGVPVAA
jgi:DNA-binding MurR/RpiR family transcriptional regulator